MQVLDECLDSLKYGQPRVYLNLTTYPLLVTDSPEPGYVTLAASWISSRTCLISGASGERHETTNI